MSVRIYFRLDRDEKEFINALIEKTIQKEKIIKYARGHGHNLTGHTFDYDKETGEVCYPSKGLKIDIDTNQGENP